MFIRNNRISLLIMVFIVLNSCKKDFSIDNVDLKTEKNYKNSFGKIDSIKLKNDKKGETYIFNKTEVKNIFESRFYKDKVLYERGKSLLKTNNFLKNGWWKRIEGDSIFYEEYKIIGDKPYLNQNKIYIRDSLINGLSNYYLKPIKKNINDSIVNLYFRLNTDKKTEVLSFLCLIDKYNSDFSKIEKYKVDTLPYTNPKDVNKWDIYVNKNNYNENILNGFFLSIHYNPLFKNDSVAIEKEYYKHYFSIKM